MWELFSINDLKGKKKCLWTSLIILGHFPANSANGNLQKLPLPENPYWKGRLSTLDQLVLTSLDLLLYIIKIWFTFDTKQITKMRRSTVLSLPFQLVFPAIANKDKTELCQPYHFAKSFFCKMPFYWMLFWCHFAEYFINECHSAECQSAECHLRIVILLRVILCFISMRHSAQCHFPECHVALGRY